MSGTINSEYELYNGPGIYHTCFDCKYFTFANKTNECLCKRPCAFGELEQWEPKEEEAE